MTPEPVQPEARPVAVIIEEDPLTRWSLENYLSSTYTVESCITFAAASAFLDDPNLAVLIWGSPTRDIDTAVLAELARKSCVQTIVLVSDVSQAVPPNVKIVEKPFALEQLDNILGQTGSQERI